MFNLMRSAYRLSAASRIVRSLLERHRATGLFRIDPKALSSKLIAMIYTQDEALFNGQKGPKPHKVSVAALALAQGIREYETHSDERAACRLSLGLILMDLEQHGGAYPFSDKDRAFIKLSTQEYLDYDSGTIFDIDAVSGASANSEKPITHSDQQQRAAMRQLDPMLDERKKELDRRMANFPSSRV